MLTREYFNKLSNTTCHNLCTYLTPPTNFQSVLGLGLKLCPQKIEIERNFDKTINRLKRDLRIRYWQKFKEKIKKMEKNTTPSYTRR